MAVDKQENTVIKKDFWADGVWHTVFFLIPLLIGWVIIFFLLVYGAYFTFKYDTGHIKIGFLFTIFALLVGLSVIPLAWSVWILLTEKITFASDRFTYSGFGSYSILYKSIQRIASREKRLFGGRGQFLVFLANDKFGRGHFYVIPRWKTLAGGVISQELSKRTTLSLLDYSLLRYYSASAAREWWLAAILIFVALAAVVSFFAAKTSPENASGATVIFWFILSSLLIFLFVRYIVRKKDVVLET
ncbi:MAG: hypothetical protein Q7R91_01845 [bacterium]|nr:hypothetical protein [bacterium]